MREFLRKIGWLIGRRHRDDELREELEFHLAAETERRKAAGLPDSDARFAARRDLGNPTLVAEDTRASWGWVKVEQVRQDVGYAIRGLRNRPAFTIGVITTMALGIGANAAMFGIVDQLLFRAPPFLRDPDQTHQVYLFTTDQGKESAAQVGRYARYVDLTRNTTSFSSTAGATLVRPAIGEGTATRELRVGAVSASFFGFFDAPPALGRYFLDSEDEVPSGVPVVVLSHGYWQTQFGGRSDAIGQTLRIGNVNYTVIGVAPENFSGIWPETPPAMFIPITTYGAQKNYSGANETWYSSYCCGWMGMIVRRKPGVSIEAATADLSRAFLSSYRTQRETRPSTPPDSIARPRALAGSILKERGPQATEVSKVATWVGGVSIIVLLIACANVASLMLARALRRKREIALRLTLGVSKSRLVSQLLTESIVLAVVGGVAGLLIATWGGAILRANLLGDNELATGLRDPGTVLFATVVALAMGLVTGLAPVLQSGRANLTHDLREGAREGQYGRSRLRTALVVVQVTLSVLLLVGAGLFVKSLQNVESRRMGYDVEPVMLVQLVMRDVALGRERMEQLRSELLERSRSIPGVVAASRQVGIPLMYDQQRRVVPLGMDTTGRMLDFTYNRVSPGYFQTMGTRITRGRGFTDADGPQGVKVAVISEALGKHLWPNADPIGQCARMGSDSACTHIVGLAENIVQRGFRDDDGYYLYLPTAQASSMEGGLFVRVRGDVAMMLEPVRRALQEVMPGGSYVRLTALARIVDPYKRSWRLGAAMFVAFGGLALVLAVVGLYSVVAYNVAQRTHEIGVRVALGARPGGLVRLVVSQGVRMAAVGVAIGLLLTLWGARWVKPLLFEVSDKDPLVLVAVPLVLFSVTAMASLIPAFRAARVDPIRALRNE